MGIPSSFRCLTPLFLYFYLPKTDVEGVPAVVHERDGMAVSIVVESGLDEHTVTVAAHHEVDAVCLGDESFVIDIARGHLPA